DVRCFRADVSHGISIPLAIGGNILNLDAKLDEQLLISLDASVSTVALACCLQVKQMYTNSQTQLGSFPWPSLGRLGGFIFAFLLSFAAVGARDLAMVSINIRNI